MCVCYTKDCDETHRKVEGHMFPTKRDLQIASLYNGHNGAGEDSRLQQTAFLRNIDQPVLRGRPSLSAGPFVSSAFIWAPALRRDCRWGGATKWEREFSLGLIDLQVSSVPFFGQKEEKRALVIFWQDVLRPKSQKFRVTIAEGKRVIYLGDHYPFCNIMRVSLVGHNVTLLEPFIRTAVSEQQEE